MYSNLSVRFRIINEKLFTLLFFIPIESEKNFLSKSNIFLKIRKTSFLLITIDIIHFGAYQV